MKTALFELVRTDYRGLSTIGELYGPDKKLIGYTLEDVVRAWGIKDMTRTAIPVTTGEAYYRLQVTMSQRFKRRMVMVFNQPDGFTLSANGISFKGIRIHGGNVHAHTDGCILVAENRISDAELARLSKATREDVRTAWMIQGSKELAVTQLVDQYIKDGFTCLFKVTNKPQIS
jgi:hypothetical protein